MITKNYYIQIIFIKKFRTEEKKQSLINKILNYCYKCLGWCFFSVNRRSFLTKLSNYFPKQKNIENDITSLSSTKFIQKRKKKCFTVPVFKMAGMTWSFLNSSNLI